MNKIITAIFIIGIIATSSAQDAVKIKTIDSFMSTIHDQGQFSGAILVATDGKVLYEKGFGFANRQTKEPFTPSTPCYIGSLSKQFVAAGIMILKEQGKLKYEDPIRKYFSQLPGFMEPITIRNLLTHSSGLAIFDDYPDMTENDVFKIILDQDSLRFVPGNKFEYCNANYTLLGMLIAQITNTSLNDFLTENVFKPIGMTSTYIDQVSSTNKKRATGYYLFGDEYNYSTYIGGAASAVSCVDDLYKWDRHLYKPKIITKQNLEEAFEPQNMIGEDRNYGQKSYGFGWFVCLKEEKKIVQHDGGFAGFRSYIERQIDDDNTIIVVSNARHSITGQIRQAINNILAGKPYEVPKRSFANWIIEESNKKDMDRAIAEFKGISKGKDSSQYYFSENEFNSLGYYLLRKNRILDAVKYFELNTEKNPKSGNAFDSLAEAYMKAGDKELAILNYKKSLILNPGNSNAANNLRRLQKE